MAGEHAFLQRIIDSFDAGLRTAGVSLINYGVVGFGRSVASGNPHDLTGNCGALGTLVQAKTGLSNLVVGGAYEDGYEAIRYALSTFSLTSLAKNFILVTDEDRGRTSPDTRLSIAPALDAASCMPAPV